jgi:trk system potassium uptake protein TrkH
LTKANSSRSKRSAPSPAPPAAPAPPLRLAGLLGPSVLIPAYILLLVAGDIAFQQIAVTAKGNELSRPSALFAVINAGTLTGFQQTHSANDFTPAGQSLVLCLIITGILFSLIAGGTAVLRIAKLKYSDRQLIAWALAATAIAVVIGAISPLSDTIFASIFTAVSAFGNSGLYISRLPAADSTATHVLLLPLAILGGLGLPVLMELIGNFRKRSSISAHAQAVLTWSAAIYILAVLLLAAAQLPSSTSPPPIWRTVFATASCESLNARSAGFPFEFATYWPRTVQWLTIILMFIGASSAGTGGGIKVNTLAVLSRSTINSLTGRPAGRATGIALTWIILYAAMLAITMMILLITEPQMPADRLLFLSFSAVGNVGLSHDPLTVSDSGLYVLCASMLAGRIAPVLILWWMATTTAAPEIAVG